jgi:hypothetical protein
VKRAALLALLVFGGCDLHRFFNDPRCFTTKDCEGALVCSAYLCVGAGTLGTGRTCWATRDCQSGQTCATGPDADAGTGYAQRCEPGGPGAAGVACSSSADCQAQYACIDEACAVGGTADRGAACATTSDCLVGLVCSTTNVCEADPRAYPEASP